ncbi:MAG: hypothetical protein DRI84_04880 [Bacteroidetes bacterium]|nr:MAG: hypothetical protein DRI84_04880 [Bacteroidota bacterium]
MTRIFIIDDHPIYIDGLRSVFQDGTDNIKISGSANSADEALPMLKHSKAEVILLDLVMPGLSGVDFCLVIKKQFPDKKVIALTGELDTFQLFKTWDNKADAIMLKYSRKDELVGTINAVLAGKRILGKGIPDFSQYYKDQTSDKVKLTKRELMILELLAEGKKRAEVANILSSNEHTINFHCRNIFRKFDKNNLVSVIERAKKEMIIS